MPTLKEIKGRIASVRSTLKITSAMKLVSSAKLRKAQKAIEAMRPYQAQLERMLSVVSAPGANEALFAPEDANSTAPGANTDVFAPEPSRPTAIIALASNSSLCGGFNASVAAKVRSLRHSGDVVYSIGRKMADTMRRDGFPSPEDLTSLAEHPSYSPAAALVERLQDEFAQGRFSRVLLVYSHFVSTAKQVPVAEVLLSAPSGASGESDRDSVPAGTPYTAFPSSVAPDAILEPSRSALRAALEPKLLHLRLYAALLDSAAAEHAARTVAMQTATDNAEKLLQELTLQYNKGRQQKITSEILDLAGGQAAE